MMNSLLLMKILFTLRATEVCKEYEFHNRQCVIELVECYFNDNKEWCDDNIPFLYTGI